MTLYLSIALGIAAAYVALVVLRTLLALVYRVQLGVDERP